MKLGLYVFSVAAVLVGIAYLFSGWQWQRGLEGADASELRALLASWKVSGQPTGSNLATFMRGRRPDLIATNGLIEINGTHSVLRFAVVRPRTGKAGTMVISDEGYVIWCGTGNRPFLME